MRNQVSIFDQSSVTEDLTREAWSRSVLLVTAFGPWNPDRATESWWEAGLYVEGVDLASTIGQGPLEAVCALFRMIKQWGYKLPFWTESELEELMSKKTGKKVTKAVGKKVSKKVTSKPASTPSVAAGNLGAVRVGELLAGGSVHVQIGKTVNIGDFQSIRVDIGMTSPVNLGESNDDVYHRTFSDVTEKMKMALQEVEDAFGS